MPQRKFLNLILLISACKNIAYGNIYNDIELDTAEDQLVFAHIVSSYCIYGSNKI